MASLLDDAVLAKLAARLGLDPQDPGLALASEQASGAFIAAVGWDVAAEDYDWTLDGDGSESLILPVAPLVDLTSVLLDGADITACVEVSKTRGVMRRTGHGRWPDRLGVIEVKARAGYETIPDDVQTAVMDATELRARTMLGIKQKTVGSVSATFVDLTSGLSVTGAWIDATERYALKDRLPR